MTSEMLTIDQQIQQFGRSIFLFNYDFCDDCQEHHAQPGAWPYGYTIGNHIHGFPELILFGLLSEYDVIFYLNELSERMLRLKRPFKDGSIHRIDGIPFKIIIASYAAQETYMLQANKHFGSTSYRVQQILVPDDYDRYPGDSRTRGLPALVPVLWIS